VKWRKPESLLHCTMSFKRRRVVKNMKGIEEFKRWMEIIRIQTLDFGWKY